MTCKRRKTMTYKDAFVVEVKCNGKILRMRDDFVHLPFGSEYSIYLKNLSARKASVKINIDGQDVLDYSALILNPNTSTELEGFLRGTTATNKFKFIKKTKEIQEHRGDKIDDGMIRVEFAYEKDKPIRKVILEDHDHHHHHHHHHEYDHYHWNHNNWFTGDSTIKYGSVGGSSGDGVRGMAQSSFTMNNSKGGEPVQSAFYSNVTMDSLGTESLGAPLDDEGITVKGSEIRQDFRYGTIGDLDPAEVIIIRMKGIDNNTNTPVQAPLTVQSKLTCSSCGKVSKSSFKYCPNCGTYLE